MSKRNHYNKPAVKKEKVTTQPPYETQAADLTRDETKSSKGHKKLWGVIIALLAAYAIAYALTGKSSNNTTPVAPRAELAVAEEVAPASEATVVAEADEVLGDLEEEILQD